jgi:hypothetical protein
MCAGELAMMVSGPWAWLDLRKCGVDFGLAALPGVGGKPGRPFVGVLSALINRSSPNGDLAVQFLEEYVCTVDGLRTIDADIAIGVPAAGFADELSAKNPFVKITHENALNGMVINIPRWASSGRDSGSARSLQAGPVPCLDELGASSENDVKESGTSGTCCGIFRHTGAYLNCITGWAHGWPGDLDRDWPGRIHLPQRVSLHVPYLFPGLLGFGLRDLSDRLLVFSASRATAPRISSSRSRSAAVLQETISVTTASYKYKPPPRKTVDTSSY